MTHDKFDPNSRKAWWCQQLEFRISKFYGWRNGIQKFTGGKFVSRGLRKRGQNFIFEDSLSSNELTASPKTGCSDKITLIFWKINSKSSRPKFNGTRPSAVENNRNLPSECAQRAFRGFIFRPGRIVIRDPCENEFIYMSYFMKVV